MKLAFVSNFLNHHQTPLCEEFCLLCDEFYFIETQNVAGIGYQTKLRASYVVRHYAAEERSRAEKLIMESDIVIFGACPSELIAMRMLAGGVSFLYSERFFKKGTWRRLIPRVRKSVEERVVRWADAPLYVLSASSWLPHDLSLLGFPEGRCYRWGYFPRFFGRDVSELLAGKGYPDGGIKILWVGRLIEFKHPEIAIHVAERLRDGGHRFCLDVVGDGEMREGLRAMIERKGLQNGVRMLGSMEQAQVRLLMDESDVFLFTSDYREGWGAVLNEAMSTACAVVASEAAGSTRYLVRNGINGCSYRKNRDVYPLVEGLVKNVGLRRAMGTAAYETINSEWNPAVAAQRFLKLAQDAVRDGASVRYKTGPCSRITEI